MCGIFGVIGDNAYEKVIKGLKLLQYRGYDSCGIAYFDKSFKINKAVGTLDNLKKIIKTVNIAFGHTRWATNGVVNLENAHPHVSFDTSITLVHNGIIKNAGLIKEKLKLKGIPFYSNTDTEVIANLIASKNDKIDNILPQLFNLLDGSFSLIIGTKYGDLYLLKRFSPLNIVVKQDEIYISSDISSLPNGKLYSLKDGDIIKISSNTISKLNNEEMIYKEHKNNIKNLQLTTHNYYMEKEIYETPTALLNTYNEVKNLDLIDTIKNFNKLTLIGCGTAYHSCLIGEYLFKNELKFNVESILASNYEVKQKVKSKHLHIIVSQSGETADCIKVAEQVKKRGGKLLLITNEPSSTLSKMSDYHIFTKAEKEIAVASTKTYCCQIFVFAYLCHKLKNENYNMNIIEFTHKIEEYLKQINIDEIAEKLKNVDKLILIGKDVDYITLLEASLKIREIDYVYTLPMYSGELKHGTLSLIDKSAYVISLNTEKSNKLQNAINEIESREGNVITFDDYINTDVDFYYKPIFSIIPFQLLSYKIAILNERNPDMPRNLAKSVTVE